MTHSALPNNLIIQQKALYEISKLGVTHAEDWDSFVKLGLEITARTLELPRVGVWMLNESETAMICVDLYQHQYNRHTTAPDLQMDHLPEYFNALKSHRIIDAHHALTDPRTLELGEDYFSSTGVCSLLDAPIRLDSKVIGIVCHERIGTPRLWRDDEVAFAAAVADQFSLAMMRWKRIQTIQALQTSERRYKMAADMTLDILMEWNDEWQMISINDRVYDHLGYQATDMLSTRFNLIDIIHPEDRSLICCVITDTMQVHSWDIRVKHEYGHWVWVTLRLKALTNEYDHITGDLGVMTIIDDRKRYEKQLEYDAAHDALTNLANRGSLLHHIQRCINESSKAGSKSQFAVIFIDLDRFKLINDSLGHVVGDRVLRSFGDSIRLAAQGHGMISRIGGDEFCVVLDHVQNDDEALQIATRIKQVCSQPIRIETREFRVGMSIGITTFNPEYNLAESMLRDADIAMYASKAEGGTPKLFNQEMHEQMLHRLNLEQELKQAGITKDFEIHYQPIVRLKDHKVIGIETLIRWRHSDRGLIYPGQFLDIAEETGLIIPIGYWMLTSICDTLVQLRNTPGYSSPPWISLNLSTTQLTQNALYDQIVEALALHDLPPELLKLEISENATGNDLELLQTVHDHIRQIGIGLMIDDFGSGHSSLSRLHDFHFEWVKIDRSLLLNATNDIRSIEFLGAVATIASTIGAQTVVEGVETQAHEELCRTINISHTQGYLYGMPTPRWQDILKVNDKNTSDTD